MFQTFALKIFFYTPIWLLKIIFYRKRTVIRGHQFDAQSAALLSLLPKKDLSELLDGEICPYDKRDTIFFWTFLPKIY